MTTTSPGLTLFSDSLVGVDLALEDHGGPGVLEHLGVHAGRLDDGSARGEVAREHRQPAGRRIGILDGADDVVGIESVGRSVAVRRLLHCRCVDDSSSAVSPSASSTARPATPRASLGRRRSGRSTPGWCARRRRGPGSSSRAPALAFVPRTSNSSMFSPSVRPVTVMHERSRWPGQPRATSPRMAWIPPARATSSMW